jgi:hypothetical protein
MHYLLAIYLILPLTQAYSGTVLPTPQEMAAVIPETQKPPAYATDDVTEEEEDDDEPDCD